MLDDIVFDDPEFKLLVHSDRISCVNQGEHLDKIFHEEMEIKYFYEGGATLLIGTETIVTQPGDIIIINPYEFHSTIAIDQQKGKYHLFMLGLDFFTDSNPNGLDLRRCMMGKRICFNHLIRGNGRLQQILIRTAEEMQSREEAYRLVVQGMLTEFFALLLRGEVSDNRSSSVLAENIRYYSVIDPALQKIHTDYHRKITIDELAAMCNVSKYHFCRIFRQATGQTAMQYLTGYRLMIADVMLNNTDKSIAEIAWDCGFTDESYFCRCYKKSEGNSPRQNRAILYQK